MSKIHTQLIEKFKTLESLVREHYGQSIYEYEQTMDESEQKKMQLIRLQRNYIQHENDFDTFIAVSEKQIQFLDALIIRIELEDGCAKDAMISVAKFGVCTNADTMKTAAGLWCESKQNDILIIDAATSEAIGFINNDIIISLVGADAKLTDKLKKYQHKFDTNFALINQTASLKELERMDYNKFVVTNKSKKIVGVIIK